MKRTTIIALTAATALLAGGTASAIALTTTEAHPENTATATPTTSAPSTATPSSETPPRLPSLTEAMAKALDKQPGTVESAERDGDPSLHWEFDIVGKDGRWYDVDVTADSVRTRPDHDDNDDTTALRDAKVNAAKAAATALASQPGTVTSVEFEPEHGTAVWETEIRDKAGRTHELTVDATTSKTTPTRDDDGDDHARHHDGDDDHHDSDDDHDDD